MRFPFGYAGNDAGAQERIFPARDVVMSREISREKTARMPGRFVNVLTLRLCAGRMDIGFQPFSNLFRLIPIPS